MPNVRHAVWNCHAREFGAVKERKVTNRHNRATIDLTRYHQITRGLPTALYDNMPFSVMLVVHELVFKDISSNFNRH